MNNTEQNTLKMRKLNNGEKEQTKTINVQTKTGIAENSIANTSDTLSATNSDDDTKEIVESIVTKGNSTTSTSSSCKKSSTYKYVYQHHDTNTSNDNDGNHNRSNTSVITENRDNDSNHNRSNTSLLTDNTNNAGNYNHNNTSTFNESNSFKKASDALTAEEDEDLDIPTAFSKLLAWTPDNSFTIQARITHIEPLRMLPCPKGLKEHFYAVLLDSQGTHMKMNFWGAIAKKHEVALKNKTVYQVSNLNVHMPNSKYANFARLELNVTRSTQFKELDESKVMILRQKWKFIPSIAMITNKEKDTVIDVPGIVHNLQESEIITTKRNKRMQRRKFELADENNRIAVTLWGEDTALNLKQGQIIAMKNAKVSDYGGRSLSSAGFIELKPQNSRIDELADWKEEQTNELQAVLEKLPSLTENARAKMDFTKAETKTAADMDNMSQMFLFSQREPAKNMFKVKASISNIQPKVFYKRNQDTHYSLRMTLMDETESWFRAVAFDTAGEKIMNMKAQDAEKMQFQKTTEFAAKMSALIGNEQKWTFHVFVRVHEYKQEKRLEFIVQDVE